LLPAALAPSVLGLAGPLYGAAATLLGLGLVAAALAVLRDAGDAAARRLFGGSILYLFGVFLALVVDRALGLGW
jgi:protoheme IX farnesyltransferase